MSTPTLDLAHELIRTACSAPSIHNTQPWSWRVADDAGTIDLYADRSRQLTGTDAAGRDLVISCGAALHHLEVAARAFGLVPETTLLPDRTDPDLLARTRLLPGNATERDVELLAALENRVTDRRGFTDWDVPSSRLEHLAEKASTHGAHVMALTDPAQVVRTERLIEQARRTQLEDPAVAAELDEWTGRKGRDGVPPASAEPTRRPGVEPRVDRFSRRHEGPDEAHRDRTDALMVICTGADGVRAWLTAGQALAALWTAATAQGMGLTPQSQVIEVESTRRRLRRDVFDGMARPQMVVRVGWQEQGPPLQERTPRRSLEDVLLPSSA